MGKWSAKLKLLNASAALPAEPAEGASAGYAGMLGGVSWVSESPEGCLEPIEQLALSRFSTSGQCRRVHSKTLNEIIVLAADNAELCGVGDTVVYKVGEARLLVGLSPEEVRAYHEVKVFFDGIIERRDPSETRIEVADLIPEGEGEVDAIGT